jgi:hypothetical protein
MEMIRWNIIVDSIIDYYTSAMQHHQVVPVASRVFLVAKMYARENAPGMHLRRKELKVQLDWEA